MKIAISSGHGKYVSGAVGYINEHQEAVSVVDKVAADLRELNVQVVTFEDTTSKSQNQNLNTIVNWHNAAFGGPHDLDVSVHFNSNGSTKKPLGTECLYYSQKELALNVAHAMADSGHFIDRGAVRRTNLKFLNSTNAPAILLEVCFVTSQADVALYHQNFNAICAAIATTISGGQQPIPIPPTPPEVLASFTGHCSWFGGPDDDGVAPDEGLAFIYSYDERPDLFLPQQPPGTTGLARRLDANAVYYVACRWDYLQTPKTMLASKNYQALVRAGGKELRAWPADWGPNESTGRAADLSPALMTALGLTTDDTVEVIYPAPVQEA